MIGGWFFYHYWKLKVLRQHRIAAVPSFAGLCRFPEGRGFKQWTGDDSKALMKVSMANWMWTDENVTTGLSSSNIRACTQTYGKSDSPLPRVLLLGAPRDHQWRWSCPNTARGLFVSSGTWGVLGWRHTSRGFLIASTAFHYSLSWVCSKWTLLVHYWVEAHQSSQTALATI